MFDLISLGALVGVGLWWATRPVSNRTFMLALAVVFILFFLAGRYIG